MKKYLVSFLVSIVSTNLIATNAAILAWFNEKQMQRAKADRLYEIQRLVQEIPRDRAQLQVSLSNLENAKNSNFWAETPIIDQYVDEALHIKEMLKIKETRLAQLTKSAPSIN